MTEEGIVRKTLTALVLAAVAVARAGAGDASPGPEPAPTPTPTAAAAQATTAPAEAKPRLDIYGFAMLDMGYQSGQNDPNWFDVAAADQAAGSFENEYGEDGRFFAGVRQSRLGVKGFIPTDVGEIKTIFEFELFGTGVDAGQTTFRLRHAWGELGAFGAGQTWSPFMDPDVFPNSIEYWGPNGMVFFRNVQVRWTPWQNGDSRFAVALERPGASADQGVYAGSCRARGRHGALPAAGPVGPVPLRGGLGSRPGRRHPAADEVGRHERRPVRPQRRRHRLGHQPQHEPEVRGHTCSVARWPSVRACRTTGTTRPWTWA